MEDAESVASSPAKAVNEVEIARQVEKFIWQQHMPMGYRRSRAVDLIGPNWELVDGNDIASQPEIPEPMTPPLFVPSDAGEEIEEAIEQEGFQNEEDDDYSPSIAATADAEPELNSDELLQQQLTVAESQWNEMIAKDFSEYKQVDPALKLPWEHGVMGQIFGAEDSLPSLPECVGLALDADVGNLIPADGVAPEFKQSETGGHAIYPKIIDSVQDLSYFEQKAEQLELACGHWLGILSINWWSSGVGRQLAESLQKDSTGTEAARILKACFGTKSPSTLLKRASAFRKFIRWHEISGYGTEHEATALPLEEPAVWEYFQHLHEDRVTCKVGYTVPTSFLEAVRFCKFTLDLYDTELILGSRRLLGMAAIAKRDKGPTRQAEGLEVEHVKKLHEVLSSSSNLVDRVAAGSFLICLYGRARWSDVRFVSYTELEPGEKGALVLFTTEHKCSNVGLRREQYLPIVVPREGVVPGDWIQEFIDVYNAVGLDLTKQPLGPLLPAPRPSGGFNARPVTTTEAARWLRALLEGTTEAGKFRSHSLKATLLLWSARAGMDRESRAVLGHHATALAGSDVVYSRHLQVRAIRKLSVMLKRVQTGLNVDESGTDFRVNAMTPGLGTPAQQTKWPSVEVPFTPMPSYSAGKAEVSGVHVPRTPVVKGVQSSATPPGLDKRDSDREVVNSALEDMQQLADLESVKEERLDESEAVEAADELTIFPAEAIKSGLVEIDSSSDTDSSSDSGESTDGEREMCAPRTPDAPKFEELVPEDMEYYRHVKSGIIHATKVDSDISFCKVTMGDNFRVMGRKLMIRLPKCIKCFPKNNNRIRSLDGLISGLDNSLKRARQK